jgi:hypothetical protein
MLFPWRRYYNHCWVFQFPEGLFYSPDSEPDHLIALPEAVPKGLKNLKAADAA